MKALRQEIVWVLFYLNGKRIDGFRTFGFS